MLICNGEVQAADWKLTAVQNADNKTVGFIYHTNAIGTQFGPKIEKIITGLRFICASDDFIPEKNSNPVVALYWNTMIGNTSQTINITIDNKQVWTGREIKWDHDGPLLLRTITESKDLIQLMKSGHNIRFQWIGDDTINRVTEFNLRNFRSGLNEFNTVCKTEI